MSARGWETIVPLGVRLIALLLYTEIRIATQLEVMINALSSVARCKSQPRNVTLDDVEGERVKLASSSFGDRQVSKVSHFRVYGFELRTCMLGGNRHRSTAVSQGVARGARSMTSYKISRSCTTVRSSDVVSRFSAIPRSCSRGKRTRKPSYEARNYPQASASRLAPTAWLDWRPQLNSNPAVHRYRFRVVGGGELQRTRGEAVFLSN